MDENNLLMTIKLGNKAYWRFEAGVDGALRIFFTDKLGYPWKEVARFNQYFGTVEQLDE